MRAVISSAILVSALLLTPATTTATVIYVDPDSPSDGPGNDWAHAFHFLQDALAVAVSGDEIRVAQGTHRPDESTANPTGTGDRYATFQLISGTGLYGGYAGYGQPDPDTRDIELYETVLSGDLLGNDGPDFTNYLENSYNVVTGSGTDATTVVDGFTLTAGNADQVGTSRGGGIYCNDGNPTVRECALVANTAGASGGALDVRATGGSMFVDRCRFEGNRSGAAGGAVCCAGGGPTFIDCVFSGNKTIGSHSFGGAFRTFSAHLSLIRCLFVDNGTSSPGSWGGAIQCHFGVVDIVNCHFLNNETTDLGGAVQLDSVNAANITNCAFSGNTADHSGGTVGSRRTTVTLTLCSFASNTAPNGRALACVSSPGFPYPSVADIRNCIMADGGQEIWTDDGSTITAAYSNIEGGWPGDGNIDTDPRFVNALGVDGIAGTEDDNLRLRWDSPCIDAGDNSAVPADVTTDLDGRPRFIDDPDTPDTGLGTPPIVDMGAYEFPGRAGDFDGDGDVDLNDFATFALCYMGAEVPPAPGCEPCDLDTDNDVDLADFATFAVNFTG